MPLKLTDFLYEKNSTHFCKPLKMYLMPFAAAMMIIIYEVLCKEHIKVGNLHSMNHLQMMCHRKYRTAAL